MTLPVFVLAFLCACGAGPKATHEIVVCDGTGSDPAAVCTHAFLSAELERWGREDARWRPGSTWRVLTTGPDEKGTNAALVVEVPERAPAGTHGWSDWARSQAPAITDVDVPADENPGRNSVESNVVAAMRVAARIAAADLPGEPVRLVVASDGMQIGEGVDIEGALRVRKGTKWWVRPKLRPFSEVVPTLPEGPMGWDLSAFSSIDMCGFHHRADAARLADRDRFWEMAFEAGHAPVPLAAPRTTCRPATTAIPAEKETK